MGRSTITLESDVEAMLKKFMREHDVTFKDAVNGAIRRGLTVDQAQVADASFPTYSMGEARVDLTHALRIAADLEDEEIARKLELGR